ncbi:single-stranded-DNA-specific exonuclease RecJ [Rhodovarius crocodyli]|uniref:Single-stranded-DNA-specific exonuclease RecJ n=2 Tax=Rhodovarius crocodyli TaxID=1979269 RepID=A0A437MFI3_9PROT|nr:single-stranded-DNA-specific exonuclease RecJ [Rhodovarius crocodyli]RVT96421.1 single-stranded-DNA-specific exonuclease RecJ [Rhodovarius crocodyli]
MLAQRLELPEMLGRLLAARGITAETAADFLDPRLRVFLPDPSVMIDMDAAAARLAQAVRAREKLAVFADYDVDGACSGALMVGALRRFGCEVTHYVPDRLKEGYGPNPAAIAALCEAGATLIVCVDCGIAAHAALEPARGRADVVILDHHKAEGPPPVVRAAVNPNRLDCTSGLKGLCAAGVAFLALVATQRELRRTGFFQTGPAELDLMAELDIVALATVCDVMPLQGVNRALVTQGIKVLARRARPGLAALMEVAGARGEVSAHTLGFTLGPRINAGGRIAEPDLGLRLLLCDLPAEARAMAEKLDAVNRRRQEVEAGVLSDAMAQGEAQMAAGRGVLLVRGEGWHPGVVGIVASRLKEKFNRPACVAGIDEGIAKGSGRSVSGLDLGSAVIWARSSGMLIAGGGHAMAAGFTIQADRLEAFHTLLEERLSGAAALPAASELVLDGALTVRGATVEMANHVTRLSPFGAGNEEPVFVLRRCRIVKADRVGAEGQVIRAFLEGEDGGRLKAVCFRAKEGPLAGLLLNSGGSPLHLAGHLRAEKWNDQVSAAFQIVDGARA